MTHLKIIQTKNTETIKKTVSPKQNPKKINPKTTFDRIQLRSLWKPVHLL